MNTDQLTQAALAHGPTPPLGEGEAHAVDVSTREYVGRTQITLTITCVPAPPQPAQTELPSEGEGEGETA